MVPDGRDLTVRTLRTNESVAEKHLSLWLTPRLNHPDAFFPVRAGMFISPSFYELCKNSVALILHASSASPTRLHGGSGGSKHCVHIHQNTNCPNSWKIRLVFPIWSLWSFIRAGIHKPADRGFVLFGQFNRSLTLVVIATEDMKSNQIWASCMNEGWRMRALLSGRIETSVFITHNARGFLWLTYMLELNKVHRLYVCSFY